MKSLLTILPIVAAVLCGSLAQHLLFTWWLVTR